MPGTLRPRPPSLGGWRVIVSLLVVLLLGAMAACADDGGDASPDGTTTTAAATSEPGTAGPSTTTEEEVEPEEVPAGDDLYEVPDPLPDGPHGTLLRYQEVTPSPVEEARTWTVMYLSESLAGEAIAVTGQVVVPAGPAPDGGRTTLAVAHGTTGIADECAPSKNGGGAELQIATPVVAQGWIVAVTDYEGLGSPGRHPYLVGESEGRSVIDSVLAAGALPDADQGDQVAIAGYSQGGHGALWAGEVAEDWAPDLDVVGTFAGAPATEVDIILRAAPSLPQAGFAYMIIAGMAEAYPEAKPDLILTPEGVDRLAAVDEGCTSDIFAAFAGVPASDLVRPEGPDTEPWATLAIEQNPGRTVTEAPVLIIHSDDDGTVPVALSGILFDRMCTNGQVVERRVLDAAGGHAGAAPEAFRQGLEWLFGLADGTVTATDGCPIA
ncbi:MAG: lipase family protein [Iamia sp.]